MNIIALLNINSLKFVHFSASTFLAPNLHSLSAMHFFSVIWDKFAIQNRNLKTYAETAPTCSATSYLGRI